MESIKDQLSKCYTNPQLIQFINTQIQQLTYKPIVKLIRKYIALTFNVPSKTQSFDFKLESNQIQFMLLLGKGYPTKAPRLFIKTSIISPGFDDCRNLLYQVIGTQNWDYKTTLKQIQDKIPIFLQNLKPDLNIDQLCRLGQFSLNSVYPVALIKQLRGEVNFVFQYDTFNALKMYIIDITSTHFLLFLTKQQPTFQNGSLKIPNQKDVTSCMLVFYAQLGSIAQMNINRVNFNDIQINFATKKPQNQTYSPANIVKKLNSRKGATIIKKILKNIKNYSQVNIKLEPHKQLVQQQQKLNLSIIQLAEKELNHKFNQHTVQNLCQCYKKSIEYYESNNIPYYQIFVDKITQLYQRPDVILIMNSQKQLEDTLNTKT